MDALTTTALIAATVTTGLLAGVFQLYTFAIMPGLRRVDDNTFVTAFAALDRAIVNPWFLLVIFFGAPVLTALAAIAGWGGPGFGWMVAAFAATVVCIVITMAVHLPANNALKAEAGDPLQDAGAIRRRFREARWAAWNLVRSVLSTGAAVGLAVGLTQ
ncbi:anthrone oxygenase family protein [Rathayibacter sp. CAU 1779]